MGDPLEVAGHETDATYGSHGRFIYHYTTSDAAFGSIIPNRALDLSRLSRMRDPVENKDWVQVLIGGLGETPEEAHHLERVANRIICETQILSFTIDGPADQFPPQHARGYARPRMWEQYAENHKGACLVFDRRRLNEVVMGHLSDFSLTFNDEVAYSNAPLPKHERARSLDAMRLRLDGRGDFERGLEMHICNHAPELFMRKLTDWVSEYEYRYVVADAETPDITIEYRDSLCAVIVGERFPSWQVPGAEQVSSEAGIELRGIRWGAFPPEIVRVSHPASGGTAAGAIL